MQGKITQDTKIVIISGPTGCGETTITNKIIEKDSRFARLVTATTRAPRGGEIEGKHYYFLSKQKFEEAIKTGDILEFTHVKSRDVYYGSYKPDLDKKTKDGKIVIVNPDIVGTKYYKENYDAVTIFIMPSSIDELRGRIQERDDPADDELTLRMTDAVNEIENERHFYDYEVENANGKLEQAIEEVITILKKEEYVR